MRSSTPSLPPAFTNMNHLQHHSQVRAFFERWYRPEHMAVVVVGDMPDTGERAYSSWHLFLVCLCFAEDPVTSVMVVQVAHGGEVAMACRHSEAS